MKKHLILFPLLAGLVLSGCEFEIFGTKISLFESGEKQQEENKEPAHTHTFSDEWEYDEISHWHPATCGHDVKSGEEDHSYGKWTAVSEDKEERICSICGYKDERVPFSIQNPPVLKEEFGNYKLAKSLEEGKQYILAAYKQSLDKMLVFNGDYHRDAKGFYPFYLGGQLDSVENAATLEIEKINEEDFYIKVHSTHEEWDGKYIGVYSAISGYANKVMSIAVLDSPTQETYTDPKSGNQTDKPSAVFKFHGHEYKGDIYAPAADYLYEGVDEEIVPKFLGTSGDYQSIDCKSYEVALDGAAYDLAHFYELVE